MSTARRSGPETLRPGDRSRIAQRRRITAYMLAIALPVATAAALIPQGRLTAFCHEKQSYLQADGQGKLIPV